MSKHLGRLTLLMLLAAAVGCPTRSHPSSSRRSVPVAAEKTPDTWGVLKPISDMEPFEGVWEGEAFASGIIGDNGQLKSGAELQADLMRKTRLSTEERREQETWYKFRLTIERKKLDLGKTAPYSADLVIERHSPNEPVSQTEKSCQFRFGQERSLELRTESLPRPEYVVKVDDSEAGVEKLELSESALKIGRIELTKLELP